MGRKGRIPRKLSPFLHLWAGLDNIKTYFKNSFYLSFKVEPTPKSLFHSSFNLELHLGPPQRGYPWPESHCFCHRSLKREPHEEMKKKKEREIFNCISHVRTSPQYNDLILYFCMSYVRVRTVRGMYTYCKNLQRTKVLLSFFGIF